MPLIVIRLLPENPASGDNFTESLTDLTITAFDISFENPDGVLIGQASYLAPEDEDNPNVPNPGTGIVQHFFALNLDDDPEPELSLPIPYAVATAVIEVNTPAGHPEHRTSDIRLEITRDGGEIVHRRT